MKRLLLYFIMGITLASCHKTPTMSSDECLICGAPLEYLHKAEMMQCVICGRTFLSDVRCQQGHYVCDECHTSGVDSIVGLCMQEKSTNPIAILEKMMQMPFCHMHGPEHHVMVGAALITAYHNAGGEVDMTWALPEMVRRGKQVPGGACGNWGACGAALSAGMYMSIVTHSSPLARKEWQLSNGLTAAALADIAEHGGPRCCKRDSYLAVMAAARYTEEKLGIKMSCPATHTCTRAMQNNQCIGRDCPFTTVNKE